MLERDNGLRDFLEGGFRLDARIQAELLLAIFHTSSPMHDGGVIIHKHRIHSSGCLLPLSQNLNIDKRYGTRHRAALGLPDETQLLAILRDIFNLKKPAARGAAERPKADAPDAQS